MLKNYDAYFPCAPLSDDDFERIVVLAKESGLNIDLDRNGIEFVFAGRDADNRVVRFMADLARIIKDSGGSAELRCDPDDGDFFFSFFEIEKGKLYRQDAYLVRAERVVARLDDSSR